MTPIVRLYGRGNCRNTLYGYVPLNVNTYGYVTKQGLQQICESSSSSGSATPFKRLGEALPLQTPAPAPYCTPLCNRPP